MPDADGRPDNTFTFNACVDLGLHTPVSGKIDLEFRMRPYLS
jgi:hypothetical protein